MWTLLPLLALPLLPTASAMTVGCEKERSGAEVIGTIGPVIAEYIGMHKAEFFAGHERVMLMLPCLREALEPGEIARIHELEARERFLRKAEGWEDRSGAALRSVMVNDREARLDGEDEGSTLLLLQASSARKGGGPSLPLEIPEGMSLLVDGVPTQKIPMERPALLQLLGDDGRPLWNSYHVEGTPAPDWLTLLNLPPPSRRAEKKKDNSRSELRKGFLIASGASALLAGGLYGLGLRQVSKDKGELPPVNATEVEIDAWQKDRDARISANHAVVFSAAGLGLASVGLGATAFLSVRW